jgi:hypothetical protein
MSDCCDACGLTPAYEYVTPPFSSARYCAECSRNQALWDAAHVQLRHQISRVCREWWAVWGKTEGISYFCELLSSMGEDLDEELNATRKEVSL